MPILDFILPPTLDPTLKMVINALAAVHIFAFLLYIYLLVRSSKSSPADQFRKQYQTMEAKAKVEKERINKQE